jgi:hypothetical protein
MATSVRTGLLGDIQAPIYQKINLIIGEEIAFLFEPQNSKLVGLPDE